MILELYINGELRRVFTKTEFDSNCEIAVEKIKNKYGLVKTERAWHIIRYTDKGKFVHCYYNEKNPPEYFTVRSYAPKRKVMVSYNGNDYGLKEICHILGLSHRYKKIYCRMYELNITFEQAIVNIDGVYGKKIVKNNP